MENLCPRCGGVGRPVKLNTVQHVVKSELRDSVSSESYFLCMTPECGTGYFCNVEGHDIPWSKFKRPVWFKVGADPVIACYCKNIKEKEVIDTVLNTDFRSVKDIMMHLRGEMGSHCEITNPQGSCCSSFFQQIIDRTAGSCSDSEERSCCSANCCSNKGCC